LHADALDGLCQQLARVAFEIVSNERALLVRVPMADTDESLRILLRQDEARFFLDRENELIAVDPQESQLDRAVFLVLAEWARRRHSVEAAAQLVAKA